MSGAIKAAPQSTDRVSLDRDNLPSSPLITCEVSAEIVAHVTPTRVKEYARALFELGQEQLLE